MRKWGAFAAFGVLLLGLIIWVKVFEDPIERHEEVSPGTIETIVTSVLGESPEEGRWTGSSVFVFDGSSYSEEESALLDHALDSSRAPVLSSELAQAIELALVSKKDVNEVHAGPNVRARMTIARSEASAELYDSSVYFLQGLSDMIAQALDTAVSVANWQDSQTGRLVFIDAVSASIEYDGWDQDSLIKLLTSFTGASHRESLSRVLHLRFANDIKSKIVEASTESIVSRIAASGIYEGSDDEDAAGLETELIGKLLLRHPRAFSPEDTAQSGAESLSRMKAALQGPWEQSQEVLDAITTDHQIWEEYLDVMQMSDSEAIGAITDLKLKFDKMENPVGIALLHSERTSWSILVQSAYVADAKEALLRIKLLTLLGREEESRQILDPLTGQPFTFSNGAPSSDLTGIGDDYGFVKAFAKE